MKTILIYILGLSCTLVVLPTWSVETGARCTAEYGGKTVYLDVQPTTDVYAMTTSDALSPFRITAQYLSERGKLKTYAYHDAKDRYVLIHAAEYSFTSANCNQHQSGFGLNKIYSARMEKELFLQCFAVCDQ